VGQSSRHAILCRSCPRFRLEADPPSPRSEVRLSAAKFPLAPALGTRQGALLSWRVGSIGTLDKFRAARIAILTKGAGFPTYLPSLVWISGIMTIQIGAGEVALGRRILFIGPIRPLNPVS
jgi:hypothetical protein